MPSAATTDTSTGTTTKPTLLVAIGRQRVGKTTFLKSLAEITTQQGGKPEIWNTDSMNRSHTIASLGSHVREANSTSAAGQAAWLEEQIERLVDTRQDAILDIGGGWTAMHELIRSSPLVAALDEIGISLVTVFMIGMENADIDYLEDLQTKHRFLPPKTAIVINEGLLPVGVETPRAVAEILNNNTVLKTLDRGAAHGVFPAVNGLKKIADRGQSFMDFAANKPVSGMPASSVFDRLRMNRWLKRDVPLFLQDLGPDYLPRMPKGLPEVMMENV
ncbi:FAD-binding oxidoreductase [Acetobacter musti]|uniref:FAD-binding oxidoreductase n=1 Tax=Acetobacter musti TaxID=864732 RepID=A0ABX0JS73_9PROT|nr:FAD-binding oxidoreductase [Acetobacter musti]NHN86054.1 FAD-binding oxidoreductase [Acetobacter musti]